MNGIVTVRLLGGMGNQVLQYLHARAYAEQVGAEFRCDPWAGSNIWSLKDVPIGDAYDLPRKTEHDLSRPDSNCCISTYAQSQRAMIFTQTWAKSVLSWSKLRYRLVGHPDAKRINLLLEQRASMGTVAHVRRGDFCGDYPLVSRSSYKRACLVHQLPPIEQWVSDEAPMLDSAIPAEISYLPDFYRLLTARTLIRANSSFSFVAGLLGNSEVYSPSILGLDAGEHECDYVKGNHSALSNRTGSENLFYQP